MRFLRRSLQRSDALRCARRTRRCSARNGKIRKLCCDSGRCAMFQRLALRAARRRAQQAQVLGRRCRCDAAAVPRRIGSLTTDMCAGKPKSQTRCADHICGVGQRLRNRADAGGVRFEIKFRYNEPKPLTFVHPRSISSAIFRSSGVVILMFFSSPATSQTSLPASSSNCASSVT